MNLNIFAKYLFTSRNQICKSIVLSGAVVILGCQPNTSTKNSVETTKQTDGYIVGGQKSSNDGYSSKSTVALYRDDEGDANLFCSGTLIKKNIILTAAHCIKDLAEHKDMSVGEFISTVKVGFGLPASNSFEDISVRYLDVESVVIHEDYEIDHELGPNNWFDIALIKLNSNAPSGFTPVPLAGFNDLKNNAPIVIAGYGRISLFSKTDSDALRHVWMKVTNSNYSDTHFRYSTLEQKGIAPGDSGGPAYIENNNGQYSVLGISSWSGQFFAEGRFVFTGVFTSVPYFTNWINVNVENLLNN